MDDARRAVEQTHQATDLFRTAHGAAQNTAAVDTRIALGNGSDGTGIRTVGGDIDVNSIQDEILDDGIFGISQQGNL